MGETALSLSFTFAAEPEGVRCDLVSPQRLHQDCAVQALTAAMAQHLKTQDFKAELLFFCVAAGGTRGAIRTVPAQPVAAEEPAYDSVPMFMSEEIK